MEITDKQFNTWMKALRSGEYKQVQRTLMGETEDGDVGYCCLGVLNKLFDLGPMQTELPGEYGILDEGPKETYEKIEGFVGGNLREKGIDMNDDGDTFEQIADELEEIYYGEVPQH